MITTSFKTALIGGLLSLASISVNAQINLKFNLKNGVKYKYTIDVKQKSQMFGEATQNNVMGEYFFKVSDAPKGNKKVSVTYDQMKVELVNKSQTIQYDTKEPNDTSILSSYQKLIGKGYDLIVSPIGEIVKVENINEAITKLTNVTIDEASIAETMKNAFDFYTNKTLNEGDSWNKTSTLTILKRMKLNVDATYTLKQVKDNVALIEYSAKINASEGATFKQGVEVKLGGTQKGMIQVEVTTGLIIRKTINQELKGSMKVNETVQPIEINSNTSVFGKEEK